MCKKIDGKYLSNKQTHFINNNEVIDIEKINIKRHEKTKENKKGAGRPTNRVLLKCPICNKYFTRIKSRLKNNRDKTCSKKCLGKRYIRKPNVKNTKIVPKVEFICKNCGKVEYLQPSIAKRKTFCSYECNLKFKRKNSLKYQINNDIENYNKINSIGDKILLVDNQSKSKKLVRTNIGKNSAEKSFLIKDKDILLIEKNEAKKVSDAVLDKRSKEWRGNEELKEKSKEQQLTEINLIIEKAKEEKSKTERTRQFFKLFKK